MAGMTSNPDVTAYIQNVKVDWQAAICQRLYELVHETVPEAEEKIQYSKPHWKKNGKYACVLGTAKDWVSFTIFNAEAIEGPDGFFEPGPPERKTIKIRKGKDVDYDLLASLLKQASSTL